MTSLTLVMKRAALTVASISLGFALGSPANAQKKLSANVFKSAKKKCIEAGKRKCHDQKMPRDRSCFSTLDRALMKSLNDKKKCDQTHSQAKGMCTRAAMLCHRSQSGAVCAAKLVRCNKRAKKKYNKCLRPIDAFKKLSRQGFKRCSNQSKRAYNKCVKDVRKKCKIKKKLKKYKVIRK